MRNPSEKLLLSMLKNRLLGKRRNVIRDCQLDCGMFHSKTVKQILLNKKGEKSC